MKRRRTTPPKVLPLLPIGLVAIYLGEAVLGVATALLELAGIEDSDEPVTVTLSALVVQLAIAVGLGFVLKWIVERWVSRV